MDPHQQDIDDHISGKNAAREGRAIPDDYSWGMNFHWLSGYYLIKKREAMKGKHNPDEELSDE